MVRQYQRLYQIESLIINFEINVVINNSILKQRNVRSNSNSHSMFPALSVVQ